MSKFDWRNGFALGLVSGIGATLVFALATKFPCASPSQFCQADAYANKANQIQPQGDRWWLIPRIVYADDTLAQWVMTAATISAAYLLLRTLWTTQQMAADTRRIGDDQTRAYLAIANVTYEAARGHSMAGEILVHIQNSGMTPAIDCRLEVGIRGGIPPSAEGDVPDKFMWSGTVGGNSVEVFRISAHDLLNMQRKIPRAGGNPAPLTLETRAEYSTINNEKYFSLADFRYDGVETRGGLSSTGVVDTFYRIGQSASYQKSE